MTNPNPSPVIEYAGKTARRSLLPAKVRTLLALGSIVMWAGAGIFLVIIIGGIFSFGVPLLGFYSGVTAVFLIFIWARSIRHIRRRRAIAVLSYLEQVMRLNLPLPALLIAAEESEPKKTARRIAALRDLLMQGLPAAEALDHALPELTSRARAMLYRGEALGQLPRMLGRLIEEDQPEKGRDVVDESFYRVYPAAMVVMMGLVVAMIMIFVMPKFEDIFRDFGMRLPDVTVWVLWFSREWSGVFAAVVAILFLAMLGRNMGEIFGAPIISARAMGGLRDRLLWALPLGHSHERDAGLADVFAVLAEALKAAMPLDVALEEVSSLDMNVVLRRRIRQWVRNLRDGMSMVDGARAAGMPRLVVGMLSTVRAEEDAAAVFAFLSRYYASRFSRLRLLLRGAVIPAVVLLFGFLVGALALGLFLPIMNLVSSEAGFSGGGR
ncbi:MAG TPA: type II secretion system F family protein [Tepidisphaeraceae bacterium]